MYGEKRPLVLLSEAIRPGRAVRPVEDRVDGGEARGGRVLPVGAPAGGKRGLARRVPDGVYEQGADGSRRDSGAG